MKSNDKEFETISILNGTKENEDVLSAPVREKKIDRSMWRSIGIVALVVVILVGIFIGGGLYFHFQDEKAKEEEYNKQAKAGLTYFQAEETEPEKSETELTSVITEAYYTNDGSLAVHICFANGMAEDKHLLSVEVKIRNADEAIVAAGYSDAIADDFVVAAGGTKELLLYISPEYVEIADDALNTISYDVTAKYETAE